MTPEAAVAGRALVRLTFGWLLQNLANPPAREMARAAERITYDHRAVLDDIPADLFDAGMIGVERVVIDRGGTYQSHESGVEAFITPVHRIDLERWRALVWPDLVEPEVAADLLTETVDLVAWHPSTPRRWATRYGIADCLGQADPAGETRVWRTPLAWLRSGCDGICPLSAEGVRGALSCAEGSFIAEDREHRRELTEALTRQPHIPRIVAA